MRRLFACLALLLAWASVAHAQVGAPVSPIMNFQGRLARPDGTPVPNGTYNLTFRIYSSASGGDLYWSQTINAVPVRNGTFSVALGHGNPLSENVLPGSPNLEIQIGSDPPLTPRLPFTSVAYAYKANTVRDNAITSAKIADGTITAADIASGGFNTLAWLLGGNNITDPTTQFLGTTSNQPLVFKTNNTERMRITPGGFVGIGRSTQVTANEFFGIFAPVTSGFGGMYVRTNGANGQPFYGYSRNGSPDAFHYLDNTNTWNLMIGSSQALRVQHSPVTVGSDNYIGVNIIGGYTGNAITSGVTAATLFGGDQLNATSRPNRVTDIGGTVSGGVNNTAGNNAGTVADAPYAVVGGGQGNIAASYAATVGGGHNNLASASQTTIGGGDSNQATGQAATVAGGYANIANHVIATVGGGQNNTAGNQSTVAGGYLNTANGPAASIGGGQSNTASASYATVPGGIANTAAGFTSFAAGRRAKANHDGAFVWADSADADFASINANQFLIRASGGVGINTNNPAYSLDVAGRSRVRGSGTDGGGVWFTNAGTPTTNASFVGRGFDSDAFTGFYSQSVGWTLIAKDSGFIGIGRTNPEQQLHLTGNVRADGGEYQCWGPITLHPDVDNNGDDVVRFVDGGGTETMRVHTDGNVGIGFTIPIYKLDVNGDINAQGFVLSFGAPLVSDVRYKTNIHTYPNALDTILNLRGVTYDWNREAWKEKNFPEGRQIGFIAQEVEKILPNLVYTDANGYKSIAYQNVVPVLVEAVKTLNGSLQGKQEQIDGQHKRLTLLEGENRLLRKQLDELAASLRDLQTRR